MNSHATSSWQRVHGIRELVSFKVHLVSRYEARSTPRPAQHHHVRARLNRHGCAAASGGKLETAAGVAAAESADQERRARFQAVATSLIGPASLVCARFRPR